MGILTKIQASNGRPDPTDDYWYYPGGSFYGGIAPTSSGIPISSDSAMRLLTVHNCVRVLSDSISQLPLHLNRKSGKKTEKAADHSLYSILHNQPNSWMTAKDFWNMAMVHLCVRGNFYAYKQQIPGRPLLGLIPFAPNAIIEVKQNDDFSITYKARKKDGQPIEFDQSQIFHIRGMVLDGVVGLNPIEYARETIGLGMANEQFMSRFFGSGMHPGAIFKHPLALSAPAHTKVKEELKKKYAGVGKSWDMMLIDEGMEVEFPQMKLVDAQFLELGKFKQSEIAGMFRVPLMLLQTNDAPITYASAEQFMITFVTHALTPWLVSIEQSIWRDLLTPKEQETLYAKFSIHGLLRGDIETRFKAYQTAINSEIMNPNEARELEDMNPYDGGNEFRTRTSTVKESSDNKSTKTKNEGENAIRLQKSA